MRARTHGLLGAALLLCASAPLRVHAQSRDTLVVVGPQYEAGAVYRFFFGSRYRELWTTPIRVPILDLRRFAGGLRPTELGGGMQTKSLKLDGADGREYRFRSADKFPDLLPDNLDDTFLNDIIKDQTHSQHPGAPLVVAPLLHAAGVPHVEQELYLMPDDPLLGEFRREFGGMLGYLERNAEPHDNPEFAAVRDIDDAEKVLPRVFESAGDRIDARALLAARLMDLFIGDWDQHRDQWEWVRTRERAPRLWAPVPEDRDHAFVHFDGLLPSLARQMSAPQLVQFGKDYSSLGGMAWNGRDLDRWFLGPLDAAAWDSIALALQARLTDSVIEGAVGSLPAPWYALNGAEMIAALRTRRDHMVDEARLFYRHLAREAEAHFTEDIERVVVERNADGTVSLSAAARRGQPWYRRTYRPGETREVRIFTRGGADTVVVRGAGPARIMVRVIAAPEAVVIDSSRHGRVGRYGLVWDPDPPTLRSSEPDSLIGGGETGPRAGDDELTEKIGPVPRRDWGAGTGTAFWWDAGPDIGVFMGAGLRRTNYGFRTRPWASQWTLRGGWSVAAHTGRIALDGMVRRTESRVRTEVEAYLSGIEVIKWHGTGNETSNDQPDSYYRVNRGEASGSVRRVLPLARHLEVAVGPEVEWATTRRQAGRIMADSTPYGAGEFGMAGLRATFAWDSRDWETAPTRGYHAELGGSVFPAVWSVQSAFSEVHASATAHMAPRGLPLMRPTFALRAGAKKVFGRYPFAQAAMIGDPTTVRLGRQNRYAGDAAVWMGGEVRLPVLRFDLLLPGELGVFGLAETGRVWVRGERSKEWHPAFGGGVSIALVQPKNVLTIALVSVEERRALYVRMGFQY